MHVGVISLINLTVSDVYIYVNHNNPRRSLHIPPMRTIKVLIEDDISSGLFRISKFQKIHSVHLLRSADLFPQSNLLGEDNYLIVEFDGVFYRYEIPICHQTYAIELPMIMGLHPQYVSLETLSGHLVWCAGRGRLTHPVKLFADVLT